MSGIVVTALVAYAKTPSPSRMAAVSHKRILISNAFILPTLLVGFAQRNRAHNRAKAAKVEQENPERSPTP